MDGLATLPSIINENWQKTEKENQNAGTSGVVTITPNSNLDYVIDDEKYEINIEAKNENVEYTIVYGVGQERKEEKFVKSKNINFKFDNEGKNDCYFAIKKGEDILQEWNKKIYKINSYKKQFLDEIETKGVGVHLIGTSTEKFLPIYAALGSQYIRVDLRMNHIYSNGTINFERYEEQLKEMLNNNVKFLVILGSPDTATLGEDGIISNNEEIEEFNKYVEAVARKYPQITAYEIINEPNGLYKTEEAINSYSTILKKSSEILKQINPKINILIGATSYSGNAIYPTNFISKISNLGAYNVANYFSYHPYDFSTNSILNSSYIKRINENKNTKQQLGGFIYEAHTEYGASTYTQSVTQEEQAWKIVQQSILCDENNIKFSMIYNFRDSGRNIENKEDNFGITTADYLPKLSYYALKKYYENTNGAEYIGKINLADGLETHLYDKDGKPKIIAWSTDINTPISVQNNSFSATDIYGKEIVADESGNITITTSPVYLDNIPRAYFYKSISTTLLGKYRTFEEKFAEQIQTVSGLQEKLNETKQMAENIGTHSEESEIDENTAIKLMETFYELGDSVIEAYQSGELDVNEQKLSSMLDDLNDVGNSYEDLITITAKTTDSVNLEETNSIIKTAEQMSNNVKNLDNVYPSKILSFSQDLYDKASYINGLQEENGIKTGLIVSTNLHSKLLANWAKNFAESYIAKHFSIQENYVLADEYIKNIPIETKVKDLKTQINSSFEYEIKRGSDVLGDDDILATGDVLQLKNTDKQYEIAVAGDLNKDGEVDIKDLVKIRKTILGLTELSGVEEHAADANMDNKDIGINDLVKIRKIILGM